MNGSESVEGYRKDASAKFVGMRKEGPEGESELSVEEGVLRLMLAVLGVLMLLGYGLAGTSVRVEELAIECTDPPDDASEAARGWR